MDLNTIFEVITRYPFLVRGIVIYIIVGIAMSLIRKVFGIRVGRIGGKVLFAVVTYFFLTMQFKV